MENDTVIDYDHKRIATALYSYYKDHSDSEQLMTAIRGFCKYHRKAIYDIAINDQIEINKRIMEIAESDRILSSECRHAYIDLCLSLSGYNPRQRYLPKIIQLSPWLKEHFDMDIVRSDDHKDGICKLPMYIHQLGRFTLTAKLKVIPDLDRRIKALQEMDMVKLTEGDKLLLEQWWDEKP